MLNSMGWIICVLTQMYSFQDFPFNKILIIITMIGGSLLQNQAFTEAPFENFQIGPFLQSYLGFIGFMVFTFVNQKTNQDFIKQSFEVLGWERQFKSIFDNLEEPVVIFSEE